MAGLEAELRQEMAASLGRVAGVIEDSIARCLALAAQAAALPDGDEQRRVIARHEEARERAREYLFYLVVQREAIGLRNHDVIQHTYIVPPRLR